MPDLPPPDSSFPIFGGQLRGNWIRLRTLILLRWGAITGQLSALMVASQVYGLQLEYGWCVLVVGVSILFNIVATFVFPESKRLTEAENLLMVLFDLAQLVALVALTGGLNNPFSILIIGPVTVSAAALSMRSTLVTGSAAIVLVTLLAEFHLPMRTAAGVPLEIAGVFLFGTWMSIVIAIIFLGIYFRWIVTEMHSMSDALQATQMALAREQKLTDLGGVVAATAHELGTPLATIKLTSSELIDELDAHPELQEDARLIREQANRCRDILRSMGQAGHDDLHMRQAPLITVLEDAANPHRSRGVAVQFAIRSEGPMPAILRRPELIHGLRNLVQNAVDFAETEVTIECAWSARRITVRILDDGPGFPPALLGRIGDPFMRRRRTAHDGPPQPDQGHTAPAGREGAPDDPRPGYEGMGLGLFIAKTLLERTGAELIFANGTEGALSGIGAVVEVAWPRAAIDAKDGDFALRPGRNRPNPT